MGKKCIKLSCGWVKAKIFGVIFEFFFIRFKLMILEGKLVMTFLVGFGFLIEKLVSISRINYVNEVV